MPGNYVWVEGIPFPDQLYSPEIIKEIHSTFLVRDQDISIVTYPKSGTNWLIQIVCLIQSKGDPSFIQSLSTRERAPWIEIKEWSIELQNKKDPRLFTSHLPVQLFPKSFFSSKAKVIYLIRNPKDCIVSGYHFWSATDFIKKPESFEGFFKDFIQGNVPFGSWFEHTRGWMALRNRDNILLLTYEELKKDTRSSIKKICEFLGATLEPWECELVLKYSSFEAMKEIKQNKERFQSYAKTYSIIMRKGIIGDWKSHFTVALAEEFDKIFQKKMKDVPQELFQWE